MVYRTYLAARGIEAATCRRQPFRPGQWVVLVVATTVLASCATRGGKIPYEPQNFIAPDRNSDTSLNADLPLGPLDVIRLTVFRIPDLSNEYQIAADGFVELPLIGRVSVRDRTPDEASRAISRLYSARYLNNPDVTIRVVTSSRNNITVEGSVINPGVYPIAGTATLLDAIALARGSSDGANPRRVAIFRKVRGQTMAAAFDVISIRQGKMTNPVVYPGDIVVVDGNNLRAVFRNVFEIVQSIAVFRSITR